MKEVVAALIVYFILGWLTFAWIVHRDCADNITPKTCAVLVGFVWPAYWAGKGGMEIFRPHANLKFS